MAGMQHYTPRYTSPSKAVIAQNAVERAAQELRVLYELRDERRENVDAR